MNPTPLASNYDLWMVALSFLVSASGAYAALWITATLRATAHGRLSRLNVLLAGAALGGISIWSMHFLGMIAFQVPTGVGYQVLPTVVSLLAAVAVSSLALGYMAAKPFALSRLLVAGPLAGLGVAVMHYMGMYGMRFGGYFEWAPLLVGLSLVIAVVAATAALWLAFHTRGQLNRIAAALVMGVAVCSMHYTGMAAASLVCTTDSVLSMKGLLNPGDLGVFVVVIGFGLLAMIVVDTLVQRTHARTKVA
ncbi:MHYT domain-containing protein [Sphaerotilaceae bacterium SBD11-9]